MNTMNGLAYDTSTGLVKATYLTKLPEWYKVATTWDVATSNKWYQALYSSLNGHPGNPDPTKITQFTVDYLWANRNKSIPKSGAISWPLAVSAALSSMIGVDKGSALANWLCGGYLHKGALGGISAQAYDANDFIDAENCFSFYDPKIRISDCLLDLKKANLAAHDWVVRAASAKYANKLAHEAIMYNKAIDSQVKTVTEVAEAAAKATSDVGTGLVKAAKGAAEGVSSTLGVGAWVLSNITWLAPVTVAALVYVAWKNKGTVAKVAVGGPAALLMNERRK